MKELAIKDLDKFLEKTARLDTPFKIYQQITEDELRAICHCRVLLISWEGKNTENNRKKLDKNKYAEGEFKETKKYSFLSQ